MVGVRAAFALSSALSFAAVFFVSCSARETARPAPEQPRAQASLPKLAVAVHAEPVVAAAVAAQLAAVAPLTEAAEPSEPTDAASAPQPTPPPDEGPILIAIARETLIYEQPSFHSHKIGYLRAGARVRRDPEPAGHEDCKLGFYRVMPGGYVCVGLAATLDPNHPIAQFSRVRPDRSAPLPYRYGRSLYPTPPFYSRLPTSAEQQVSEVELARHLSANTAYAWRDTLSDPTPAFLENGGQAPVPFGLEHQSHDLVQGRAVADSSFALLGVYDHQGRRFGLTTGMSLVPMDRLKPVVASTFQGVALGGDFSLPLVFVRSRGAFLYTSTAGSGVALGRALGYREALSISGRSRRVGGVTYLETKSGELVRDENLVRVDKFQQRPGWVKPGRSWLHVSILKQTLVAYEGETPVYATLVSTGADGMGDPATTHSTARGVFLIHTKHVTATMDNDEVGDEFDLPDVPYVQYFTEGFALHAAYWHDAFGQPHSHGCVNLAPLDARWLFHWTDPPVPQAWHGAMSLRGGTLVYVSP
ncbi:MAG TPA: L,D-transpeptidase [Polyangiaceae bacterium]